ncbi:hypothetical protein OJ996_25700 [Luteolibacter sp. GHJ8]|uniref:Uncharacterized protein n=1 Tax=Luteolibacter rhizosphaerae TaxID=2989719 RepID=A0ABT3GB44_9BACT|nr:hypothetical protein [Luteolibacter rhizosphaerae]MCW1917010.1 hypothetical protein [Luteolibacter rhizosphaerae]
MSWRRMTIIVVGLVPFVFLLWLWGAGMRNPAFVRFPWGTDTGLLVHKGDELRLLKLDAPMGLPRYGHGFFSPTGTFYHLFGWSESAVKKDIAVPQWALVAAYVAVFMAVYVRMGVKGNRGRAEVLGDQS